MRYDYVLTLKADGQGHLRTFQQQKEKAEYTCVTCGRTAEKADMICRSIKLH